MTRYSVIGPGSKTLINTKMIKSKKVAIEKQSSAINIKGIGRNRLIQEKTINNTGTIAITKACFLEVDKEKIPANRSSIQKIFRTTVKNE
jgi:hypothetical protein